MWLSLIVMLVSYFLSAKSGNSKSKSAAIAATAGLGTYWATQNTDWGASANQKIDDLFTDGNPSADANGTGTGVTGNGATKPSSGIGGALSSLGNSAADVLKNWGPVGTVGAVAGVSAVTGGGGSWFKNNMNWLLPAGLLVGLFLLVN